jgi:hypothetical protein
MKELKFNMDLAELKEQIENEQIDTLLFLGQLKRIENEVKELRQLALESALLEFEKYGEKTVKLGNYEFSKSQSGRHSYKHSQEWLNLDISRKKLEKDMQMAYKYAQKGEQFVLDGVVIEPSEYKANKESISIKLK